MGNRAHILCLLVISAVLLGACGDDTKRSNDNNFVCFWTAVDSPVDQFKLVESLVREYPPASGLPILAGLKQDAAISVHLPPNEGAKAWIKALPDSLRHHELIKSVKAEDWDCAKIVA